MTRQFEITADSTVDFMQAEIKAADITVAPLEFTLTQGDDVQIKLDNFTKDEDYTNFYQQLRQGIIAKTSILSVQAHVDLFMAMAQRGVKNVLHISQGYGLSPTVDNANAAIAQVKKQYPDINYLALESNTTTVGEGMILQAAIQMRDAGQSLEATFDKLNVIKNFTQHFILVNDLKFLARGGRISNVAANFGSMLQVKPIIEFGRDGKLKVCRKELGLKKALRSIVNDYGKFTLNQEFPYIQIVHTDNLPLAEELQKMLETQYHVKPQIRIMGPIIGAHVGPGAVAYGFISNEPRPYA